MTEPLNQQILEEASAWFIEFRASSLARGGREEFMEWLRRSPDHIRAYLEVSRLYVQLPGPELVPASERERLLEKARARLVHEVVPIEARTSKTASPQTSSRAARWRSPVALAASLLLVGGAVAAWWTLAERGLYATQAGESRTVMLPDSSRIELNGRTRLRVAYSAHLREVELIEGQALFQVAKDRARSFVVDTGAAQIRAVGTAFDVARNGTDTTVTVLEGVVAVLPAGSASDGPSTPASDQLLVTAGEQAVVTPQGSAKPRATNISAATAWTRGQLEFDETPLSQVAEGFNRSSPRPLVLPAGRVGDVRISGIYSSVDPASLILFLRSQPDLEVTETADRIEVQARAR